MCRSLAAALFPLLGSCALFRSGAELTDRVAEATEQVARAASRTADVAETAHQLLLIYGAPILAGTATLVGVLVARLRRARKKNGSPA